MFGSLFGGGSSNNLDSKAFEEKLNSDKNGVLIDVRTKEEYQSVRIPGAKLIDIYDRSFKEKIEKLDKNKTYYVYCQSGSRSGQAARMMKGLGFENVYNLATGIGRWQGKTESGR